MGGRFSSNTVHYNSTVGAAGEQWSKEVGGNVKVADVTAGQHKPSVNSEVGNVVFVLILPFQSKSLTLCKVCYCLFTLLKRKI